MMVLDSGAIYRLAERTRKSLSLLKLMRQQEWPALVPSIVLVECLTGDHRLDANTNRLLKTCDVIGELSEVQARRAANLRYLARRGSAVDAIVVATAEPGGVVFTSDTADVSALAARAESVGVVSV